MYRWATVCLCSSGTPAQDASAANTNKQADVIIVRELQLKVWTRSTTTRRKTSPALRSCRLLLLRVRPVPAWTPSPASPSLWRERQHSINRLINPPVSSSCFLPTWEVFDVHTSEVAQSVLVVGGVVPDDAIIFAREVVKPAVDRRHPGQVIQHFLDIFDNFLEEERGDKGLKPELDFLYHQLRHLNSGFLLMCSTDCTNQI